MNFTTSPFLYRLNFLIKHKANIKIILVFLKFQSLKFFYNYFRSKEKKKNKILINDKEVTRDDFSIYSFDWKKNLKAYKDKNIKYLEIGSFEGISAYFIHKYSKLIEIHCVDTWEGNDEYGDEINFQNIELNFDKNLKDIKYLKKYKTTSDAFFKDNKKQFDIIYIDGSHKYNQVKKDLINALKNLKFDGIIICDDYFWNLDGNKEDIPVQAINEVVIEYDLKIEAITVNQIFLKKN